MVMDGVRKVIKDLIIFPQVNIQHHHHHLLPQLFNQLLQIFFLLQGQLFHYQMHFSCPYWPTSSNPLLPIIVYIVALHLCTFNTIQPILSGLRIRGPSTSTSSCIDSATTCNATTAASHILKFKEVVEYDGNGRLIIAPDGLFPRVAADIWL